MGKTAPERASRAQRDDFLVFGSPLISEEEIEEVVETLRSGWIGTGPRVARFEEAFRNYKGASNAVALNSCTAALHIALLACGVAPGDEVITTPMTFAATANAIVHAGARPVFADCERDTLCVSPEAIEAAITPKTKAILPVHFAGRPCDMDALCAIARDYDLLMIEDCAHAIEAVYKGTPVGLFGDASCFSFYVTKNLVTGEGGMLLTGSDEVAARSKVLSLHGMTQDAWKRFSDSGYEHYQVVEAGFKYNMMDIQAALGLHQLAEVDKRSVRRQEIWEQYDDAFADLPCALPAVPEPDTRHAYHLYTLVLDIERLGKSRDDVLNELKTAKIGTGVHYTALHLQPFYRKLTGHREGDFPNAEHISERILSIPLSAKLSDQDAHDVIDAVCDSLSV